MNLFTSIIIELLILCFFAFLYYVYTKKRIVHSIEFEFGHRLNDIILQIHHFLDENKEITSFNEINSFVNKLETLLDKKSSEFPLNLEAPNDLPNEIKEQFSDFLQHLQ